MVLSTELLLIMEQVATHNGRTIQYYIFLIMTDSQIGTFCNLPTQ